MNFKPGFNARTIGGCQFSCANKLIYYLRLITTAGTGAQGLRSALLLVRAFRARPFLIFNLDFFPVV